MSDNEETKIKNVQLYPTRTRLELNDKATKVLFSLTQDFFERMVNNHAKRGVIEKRNHRKYGKIKSTFEIFCEAGYTLLLALDEFDRAVLDVCISEWDAGNRYITIPMILRGLTGKVGKNGDGYGTNVYKDQETAIKTSIGKLMAAQYSSNIVDAFEKLKYTDENGKVTEIVQSPILPCQRIRKYISKEKGIGADSKQTVNGQEVEEVIHFLCESPLYITANLKNQILRYDVELLDVPNLRNTPLVIMLKNYVLRRVVECKQHKMTPTITLDDVFTKCRISDKHNQIKADARETLDKLFSHLQDKKFIKSYEWRKKRNKFDAITFKF